MRAVGDWPMYFSVWPHLSIGENVQKWRLRELRGEALTQGAVKHCVTGSICEIGEDNRAFAVSLAER